MDNNNNEIDIVELLLKTFIFFKKYLIIFVIAIILGFAFGKIKTNRLVTYYNSEMLLISKIQNDLDYKIMPRIRKDNNIGNTAIITNIVNTAQSLIKSQNFELLEQRTGIDKKQLQEIVNINSKIVADDNSADFDYITVNVTVKNPEILNNLGAGIINFINNNEYIKEKTHKDSLLILELIAQTDKKIETLEEYQKKTLQNSRTEIMLIGKSSIFSESVDLMSYKQKLMQELYSLSAARMVENFYTPKYKAAKSSNAVYIYPFLFFALAFFIALIIEINKKSKEIIRQKEQKENN